MADEATEACVKCVYGLITSTILAFFFLCIGPSNPKFSIERLYVPSLDVHSHNIQAINANTISFRMAFWNTMSLKETYCDDVNVTVYYGKNLSLPIATTTIPEFTIDRKGIFYDGETIETVDVPWEDARSVVSNGSTVMFRVNLVTNIRYTTTFAACFITEYLSGLFPYTRRYGMRVGAYIDVNDHGKSTEKINWLSSKAAPVHVTNCVSVIIVALLVLLFTTISL
ncbi:hypothetical protein C5167_035837 [Papaver somniferum]|uniref:uncharacterized protein LOC113336806 n=1 Tax=Papaver somniferum TaxID=3469 RepID=UPI000E6F53BA|nr:uncharacterized protein LOC113336806 [Papaver somniferum]RZC89839.1 hypothetical protein C5167_035837 [Papaver somniferum]